MVNRIKIILILLIENTYTLYVKIYDITNCIDINRHNLKYWHNKYLQLLHQSFMTGNDK